MDETSVVETRAAAIRPDTAGDVAGRIREDARRHPERTYRQHVEVAREIAATEYRAETRRAMREGRE